MKRAIDGILVAATIVILLAAARQWYNHRTPGSSQLFEGLEFPLAGMDWDKAESTVVMGLSLRCSFCMESTGFYQRLAADATAHNYRMIAIFPEARAETEKWLSENKITVSLVRRENLPSLGISVTPTLALVDRKGIVKRILIGKLSPEQEDNMLSRASQGAGGSAEAHPRISESDFVRTVQAKRHVVLDVRDRQSFAKSHHQGAVNIPFDELGVRARIEIQTGDPVVVDCRSLDAVACQFSASVLRRAGCKSVFLLVAP